MKVLRCLALVFCVTASFLYAQRESLLIGPGRRTVWFEVFDTPELDYSARVTDKGELPLVLGVSVKVASLTPSQAATVVEQALIAAKIMYHPRVLVTVQEYATQSVTVSGQVVKPGIYIISTPRSIIDVLQHSAGGLTDLADRHVTIQRAGSEAEETVFISNDPTVDGKRNTLVYPSDSVLVPKAGLVYVMGDVARPGGYPRTNNESTRTVLQAVALAGGTASTAVPSHTKLIRRAPDGYTNIPLQLK